MKTLAVAAVIALTGPVAAAGLLPSGVPGATGGPWGAWVVQTIDTHTNPLVKQYVDIDAQGRLHVYYRQHSPIKLIHGVQDGLEWNQDVIWTGVARPMGMKVDDAGVVHMLRYTIPNLVYHRLDGTTLTSETVDSNGPEDADLAIDDSGRVHVAYAPSTGYLYYAVRSTSGIWSKELVATNVEHDIEVDVDDVGGIHIVYMPFAIAEARYAKRSPAGAWTNQEILGCNNFVDIAVDAAGSPHVGCWAVDGLRYARLLNGQWQREFVENGTDTGYEAAIAVDNSGTPHFAYRNRIPAFTDDPLGHARPKYATKTALGWAVENIDHDRFLNGFAPAIDVDAFGRPIVTYVLGWRAESLDAVDSGGLINPYTDLRLARPATTMLTPVGT